MFNGCNLQETFLGALQQEQIPVAIYLVNGIKLQGQVDSFDQEVIMLKSNITQMVYKHSISTIVPVCQIRYAKDDAQTLEDIALSVIQETDL